MFSQFQGGSINAYAVGSGSSSTPSNRSSNPTVNTNSSSSCIRPSRLSRETSFDSQHSGDEFVILTPTSNPHRVSSPSEEFEFIHSHPYQHPDAHIPADTEGEHSRRPSQTATLIRSSPSPSSNLVESNSGLAVPLISRAVTDYFLKTRPTQEGEESQPIDAAARQPMFASTAVNSDFIPPTLTIPTRQPAPAQAQARKKPVVSPPPPVQSHEDYYDDYYDDGPLSPDTLYAYSGYRPSFFGSVGRLTSSSNVHPVIRQRHQSALGHSRVTHKSLQTRKEQRIQQAVALKQKKENEAFLAKTRPSIVETKGNSSKSTQSSTLLTPTSSHGATASNLLVDPDASIGSITLMDVASHLASTVPQLHESRTPMVAPPSDRRAHNRGLFNRPLASVVMKDYEPFQRAFFQHYRSTIEEAFHSATYGLRLVSVHCKPEVGYEAIWAQSLLDALNDPSGTGIETTRLDIVFEHVPNKPSSAHSHSGDRIVYTPSQVRQLHARFAADTPIYVDGRWVLGYKVRACALLQSWSTNFKSNGSRSVKTQEFGGGTKVLDPIILAPMLEMAYVEIDAPQIEPPASTPSASSVFSIPISSTQPSPAPSSSVSTRPLKARDINLALNSTKRARQHQRERIERQHDVEMASQREMREYEKEHSFDHRGDPSMSRSVDRVEPAPVPPTDSLESFQADKFAGTTGGEDDSDQSYLRNWSSLQELEQHVASLQHQRQQGVAQHVIEPRWAQLEPDEIEQLINYRLSIERQEREERQRLEEERDEAGQDYPSYVHDDERRVDDDPLDEVYGVLPSSHHGPRGSYSSSDFRAAQLSRRYDDTDISLEDGLLHSKLPRASALLGATPESFGPHGNYNANVWLRTLPKMHYQRVAVANKNSKRDVNYPVKPLRQERLNNQRNYRTEFYNQQQNEDED